MQCLITATCQLMETAMLYGHRFLIVFLGALMALVAGCGSESKTSVAEVFESKSEVEKLLGVEIAINLRSCDAGRLRSLMGGTIEFVCFAAQDSWQMDAIVELLEKNGAPNASTSIASETDLPSELFDAPKLWFTNSQLSVKWENLDKSDHHFVRETGRDFYHLAVDRENNFVFLSRWTGTLPR